MKVTSEILNYLSIHIDDCPPENGGIFGSSTGDIIDKVIIDKPQDVASCECIYCPNIEFLNGCIDSWTSNNIRFMGMFHTHFAGVKTLSDSDKEYITEIMNAMPDEITYLFFPIYVIPSRELVCYRAKKFVGSVLIENEALEII